MDIDTSAGNTDIIGIHKDERVKGKWLQLPQLIINCYVKFRYGLLWQVEQKAKILRYSRTVERSWISNNLTVSWKWSRKWIKSDRAANGENTITTSTTTVDRQCHCLPVLPKWKYKWIVSLLIAWSFYEVQIRSRAFFLFCKQLRIGHQRVAGLFLVNKSTYESFCVQTETEM